MPSTAELNKEFDRVMRESAESIQNFKRDIGDPEWFMPLEPVIISMRSIMLKGGQIQYNEDTKNRRRKQRRARNKNK